MYRRYLRSLAFAAGFYPMAAAGAAYESNMGALAPAMRQMFEHYAPHKAPPKSCIPRHKADYDEESLHSINRFLGMFKEWLIKHDRFDESYPEYFFGERDLSEEEELVYNSYIMIFDYHEYEAGTEQGLDFLRANESDLHLIANAYANHAVAQKYMMDKDVEPRSLIEMADMTERLVAVDLRDSFSAMFMEPMMGLYEFTQAAMAIERQMNEKACPDTSPVAQPY